MMSAQKLAGIAVHIFTALGAVCGLMALHSTAGHHWAQTFAWLGVAAIIDGLDGPIARKVEVEKTLPRFSGVRLDLVVDYLNYCIVPAFVLLESGRAGESWGIVAAIAITLGSLYHFADVESKTEDGFFVGFPGIWNVVVFYFFAFDVSDAITLIVTLLLVALTFIPLKWVHPFRVTSWRYATCLILLLWSLAAAYQVLAEFPGDPVSRWVLGICCLYLVSISMYRSAGRRRLDTEG